jgi:hypothetical protein
MEKLNLLQIALIDFADPITDEENDAVLNIFDYSDISLHDETFIMILLNSTFRNQMNPEIEEDRDSLIELARVLKVTIHTITDMFGGLHYSPENIQEMNQIIFDYFNIIIGNIYAALRLNE